MFHLTRRQAPLSLIASFLLILNSILVACEGPHMFTPTPTPTIHKSPTLSPVSPPSFACNQPQPTPAPGKITLRGVGYGPYHTGQNPNYGISPSSQEIQDDMPTLSKISNYIRIYASTGPAEALIQAAEQNHMCVNLGIWLGKYDYTGLRHTKHAGINAKEDAEEDEKVNAREITAGARLASSPAVRALTVGNEVFLRDDLSEKQLISDIEQVRALLKRPIPITVADDFNQWLAHPNLAKHVDFITVHIYPFWNGVSINDAIGFLNTNYQQIRAAYPGIPIVIGETGWPDGGPPQGRHEEAVPSPANQALYFEAFIKWAQQNDAFYFYFDAFDEEWKTSEGGVGTHWGLYQADGHVKSHFKDVLQEAAPATIRQRSFRDVYVGSSLEAPFDLGIDTSKHQYGWLAAKDGILTLDYPEGQLWGAMFITVGKPIPPGQRPPIDLSKYHTLSFDIRAQTNGQRVYLGIKDRTQPDDSSEITLEQSLTTGWSTMALSLDNFANVDLKQLYVVFEVVFLGSAGASVELRNIRYAPDKVSAIQTPSPESPFTVYTDAGDPDNHYVPSGAMGDYGAVTINENWTDNPHSGTSCIQVVYTGATPQGQGWAGFYWQTPVNNWGKVPGPVGYDLSKMTKISFWVRGMVGGELVQFLVGGITGPYPDSLQPAAKTEVITLTTGWQLVTIDLHGKDLTHIIGGFGWVTNTTQNPHGATFYLDDIVYS